MPELPSVTSRANHSTAIKALVTGAAVLAILLLFRAYSYLLFHTVAELYSIVIAITYFVIAWHTRGINENPTIATLGIAYVFIAILDTFHTLAFTGMNIFQGYAFPANQLWILGRFFEALSLASFSFITLKGKPRLFAFLACYALYTAAGLAAVFVFRSFPVCFIAGQGQTPFKLAAEYSIIAILSIASILLYRRRGLYPRPVHRRLQASILLTILAELSFTLYFSNYDWANMTGHFFKIASFYLVYRSIVVTGLERPQELFYARLRQSEQALRRANATQNAIIAILSHDLKGPLSAVKNLAETVSGEAGAFPAPEERLIVSEIALAVGRSLALLERTLEWARASGGEFEQHTEALSLSEAAGRALDFLANNAREKSISLSSSAPDEAEVLADRDMLDFILRNLSQNAIKFTPPGGAVRLSAWREASNWVLAVEDSGVGMDESELASLFTIGKRFHKAGTAGEQGTGLGLVLCQDFAAKMGGSITAASEAGKGSILRLSLPSAEKPQRGS